MTTSLLHPALDWLFLAGFLLLLVVLAAIETLWPLHASPLQPKGRLLTNFGLGLLNNSALALIPVSLIATAEWAKQNQFGLLNLVQIHWLAAGAITIVMRSLASYWLHRISHANGLLWRIHRVHHCDVAVDLSTGFRNHPFEALVVAVCMLIATALIGFAPIPLAWYEAAALAFAIWSHANVRLPATIEPLVRALFVTPDMHHVHHSAARHQTDSNFGDFLSVWDRLFGTYCALDRSSLPRLRFGLEDGDHPASLLHQLGAPLRRASADQASG
jgi:sterol desaturase/sphingolipid hydroxylase (fatty acid hydroxylase superfamily)